MAVQTLGDPRGGTSQNLAEVESLAKRLEEVKGDDFKTWGTTWLTESLQDHRAKYGDAAESPSMDGDEDELSQASTEPVGQQDVEMGEAGAGLDAAPTPEPGRDHRSPGRPGRGDGGQPGSVSR